MTEIFHSIYLFFIRRRLVVFSLLLVFVGLLFYFSSQIRLEEDISGFMPKGEKNDKINFVYKNIKVSEKIIFQLESILPQSDDSKDFLCEKADELAAIIDSSTSNKNLIQEVFYKVQQDQILDVARFINDNAPYFLNEEDYQRLDSLLNSENVYQILENNKKILLSPGGMVMKEFLVKDPLHFSASTLSKLRNFQLSQQFNTYNDYIFSKDNTRLLFFVSASNSVSETRKNKELVKILDQAVAKLQQNSKGKIRVSYFGAAAVAVANADRIKDDSYLSSGIAIVLILLVLLLFFRNLKYILLIAVPVIFGALVSLAALYYFKGTISAIALGAGSVIFGIAINYSLHFLIHFKHEKNVGTTLRDLASPMITGSITTVGAFLSLLFIRADSMRDFGIFAAFSLLGTMLFVLLFLPLFFKKSDDKYSERKHTRLDRIVSYRLEKIPFILPIVFILTLVLLYFSGSVGFQTDMNKLNFMKPEQKKAFEELSSFTSIGKKNIFFVAEGKTLSHALEAYEKGKNCTDSLLNAGLIKDISGIGDFIPSVSMQKKKIERWNKFLEQNKERIKAELAVQGKKAGFNETAFSDFFELLDKKFETQDEVFFIENLHSLVGEYIIQKPDESMVVTILYAKPATSDKVLGSLHTKDTFTFDSSSIAKSLLDILSQDFNTVLYFCSILVLLFLTISFGRLELSLISFLPMLISWIWILGIMAIFGIQFNIVNIILATFIFGLGDDYTIFMMDGLMNEYAYRKKLLDSYKIAVALSAVTMFIGIGALVFAQHPAMKSLANVTIIGMISVVVVSYIIPAAFFQFLTQKKRKNRLIPITLRMYAATVYSFAVFILGSILLTIYGFFLLTIGGKNEKNKYRYHQALHFTANWVIRHLPLVKTTLINEVKENFSKPGIIISNHQSHLDLMFIMMLSPKVVILTNEWVWKSPFYGMIIRYADFYPVANGIENSVGKLKTLVDRGYSIVVFPEGTRSEDCSILRFHRGAFFLAEQLQLDIIPVVVHGIGHALPKTELLLRKGEVHIKILNRIKANDGLFGMDYIQRSKIVRQMYKKEYAELSDKVEKASYFSDRVFHNFVYKGRDIERIARKTLKKYADFEDLISHLPDEGKMLNPECGIGIFPIICALVKKKLQIIGFDEQDDKIALASNCSSVSRNLRFINSLENVDYQEMDFMVFIEPLNQDFLKNFPDFHGMIYILYSKGNNLLENFSIFENYSTVEINEKLLLKIGR